MSVSVCIATYNGEKYIKEQVESILVQLSCDDEIVVSDDGSTDRTLSILKSFDDSRIRIFGNGSRRGVVGNFESALRNAVGDYIFLCDQDDVWIDGKVQRCVEVLESGGVDLVMHDAVVWDGYGVLSESFYELRGSRRGYFRNLWRNSFLGCCLAFRKEMLRYVLPIPNVAMHDIWIGLIVSRRGRVELIDDRLIMYRRHGENASPTAEKSTLSLLQKVSYRVKMFVKTILR